MINSSDINELKPKFRALALLWLDLCEKDGLEVRIYSTYRDNEFQNYLYSLGRSTSGRIVTNKRGGQSEHNHRNAFDFLILKNKKADWENYEYFKRAGELAESIGLIWSGRWEGKLKEVGHIEGLWYGNEY